MLNRLWLAALTATLVACGGGGADSPPSDVAGVVRADPHACFTGPAVPSGTAQLTLGGRYSATDCSTGVAITAADIQANDLAGADAVDVSYRGLDGSCGGGDSFTPGGARTAINFTACTQQVELTVCIARSTWADSTRRTVTVTLMGCTSKTFSAA